MIRSSPENPTTTSNLRLRVNSIIEASEKILVNAHKELVIPGLVVGQPFWSQMIGLTQEKQKEYCMLIGENGIAVKGIIEGDEKTSPNPLKLERFGGHIGKFRNGVVYVHTHPLDKIEDAHLKTTVPSDGDIGEFTKSPYKAFIILDRGGAHILIKPSKNFIQPSSYEIPPFDLVNAGYKRLTSGKRIGTVSDLQVYLAKELPRYNIGYFFTQNIEPDEEGNIIFKTPEF